MLYIYGMKNRPFSQGTFPGDGFKGVEHLTKRWYSVFWERYQNVLVYERELQTKELQDHELDFICTMNYER